MVRPVVRRTGRRDARRDARRDVRRGARVGAPLATAALVSGAPYTIRRRWSSTSSPRRRIYELAPYDPIDSPPADAARAAGSSDLPDELKRLADLKAAGALTDAEFAAAKAHLLTR